MDASDRAMVNRREPTLKRDLSIRSGMIREVNNLRKHGGWYTLICVCEGKDIQIKGYHTWLQIYKVDGVDWAGRMDVSVQEFKDRLKEPFVTPKGVKHEKETEV